MAKLDAQISVKTRKGILEDLKFIAEFENKSVNALLNDWFEKNIDVKKEEILERLLWNKETLDAIENYEQNGIEYSKEDILNSLSIKIGK